MTLIRLVQLVLLAVALSVLPGCLFTRTIYVPHGAAVQIRQTIKNCQVWVRDKDGKKVAGTIDIPEGWMALPLPKKDETNGD